MVSIHSIYRATEGEGVFIGTPQIFVRFQGCTVGCLNCDSKETWDFDNNQMTFENVLEEIEKLSVSNAVKLKRISITGGDPLHPKNTPAVLKLSQELKNRGYFINIEAAGTRVVHEIFDLIDYISMDLKTPSTGVKTNINVLQKLVEQYPNKFQIKSVVANNHDFQFVYDNYIKLQELTGHNSFNWVITPCYEPGEAFPKERFFSIIELNESFGGPFRVIGQQHKWIHGPDKRNV